MKAIATQSTMQKSLNMRMTIANQDAQLAKAQNEVATGLRQDVYADTGFRAAQSLDLRNRMDRTEQYKTSNNLLNGKLDIVSKQIASIRNAGTEFMTLLVSIGSSSQGLDTLASQAKSTLNAVNSMINTTYAGEYLFSGTGSNQSSQALGVADFPSFNFTSATSLADIDTALADLDAFFGLNGATPAANGYAAQQGYSGAVQNANLDESITIDYGITGKDEAFALLYKGLTMYANADATQLGDDVYKKWIDTAISTINSAVSMFERHESVLGNQQALIKETVERQENLKTVYNNRIADIEGVDSYEAALRLENLTTQLETSYAVTSRMQGLTLLNYL